MSDLPLGPLMVDVSGTQLSADETAFLSQPAIGGVILFARNYRSKAQVAQLIDAIKSIRNPSLLIAVDQEGGRVQRFKHEFFALPAAYRFGQAYEQDPESALPLCRAAGCVMATELIQVGVDFSFAPVLDCANLNSKAIGDRGFHEQPKIVAVLAGAFIDGMSDAGMAATGKHFPGHGGVTADSHFTLPVDDRSLDQIAEYDLVPYKKLAAQLGGVMTAHIQFPRIDIDAPTFSAFWLQQILRQEIGFSGLIFSDDLSMKGAQVAGNAVDALDSVDVVDQTKRALQAGCDMALICNDPKSAARVADELGKSWAANQPRLLAMRAKSTDRITETEIAKLKDQVALMAMNSA